MPAARRTRGGKSPEPAAAAADTVAQPDETTEAPKRTRAPKTYPFTGEDVFKARYPNGADGPKAKWNDVLISLNDDFEMGWEQDEESGAMKQSAIPFRAMLQKYEADSDEDNALDIGDPEAIVEAMKSDGAGWTQLVQRTGAKGVAEVKDAIRELLAEEDINVDDGGRGYGKGDSWKWVTRDELNASKAANKEAAENGDGDDDEEDDDEGDEDTPAPARRPGRRNA